jgi:hypothetical protein
MRDRRAVLVACLATLFAPLCTAAAAQPGGGPSPSGPGSDGRPPPPPRHQPPMYREAFRRRLATKTPPEGLEAAEGERALSPLPHQAEKNPPDWP